MTLPRADKLKEPPTVGRYYMVPAVFWNRGGGRNHDDPVGAMWWPVWGIKHNDKEFFNFTELHYHIDPRFLKRQHWRTFSDFRGSLLADVQAWPLSARRAPEGPPRPTLRKFRCSLAHAEWKHHDATTVVDLNQHYAEQQAPKGKRGFVCPHRHFALGSIKAIDGVVTCPLHGLRIDASTGQCLGPRS
jgi:hypothetical protein